MTIEVP